MEDTSVKPGENTSNVRQDQTDLIERLRNENETLSQKIFSMTAKLKNSKENCNALEKQNKILKKKLSSHEQNGTSIDKSCQTDSEICSNYSIDGNMNDGGSEEPAEVLSAKSITAVAQSALSNSGWIYDETTSTYFDYNTNLYYYPETRLYYNYVNGCYYKFNQETKKYDFHYQHESFKQAEAKTNVQEDCPTSEKNEPKGQLNEDIQMPNLNKLVGRKSSSNKENTESLDIRKVKIESHSVGRRSLHGILKQNRRQKKDSVEMGNALSGPEDNFETVEESQKDIMSDTEAECINCEHKRYLICRKCGSLISNSCCGQMKHLTEIKFNSQGGENSTRLKGKEKFSQARKIKSRFLLKKFLIHCMYEENELSLSDSECDTLTSSNAKLVLCSNCGNVADSTCCEKRSACDEQLHLIRTNKRKYSLQKAELSLKRKREDVYKTIDSQENVKYKDLKKEPLRYNTSHLNIQHQIPDESDDQYALEDAERNAIPCIRAVVTSSAIVQSGTLFIITCQGALIGSSTDCDIQIQEDDLDEKHVKISFNPEQRNYFVADLGSVMGTSLNSFERHQPGQESVIPSPVTHKSVLVIGSTTMVLHLHLGYETCDECEPGQIQALLGKQMKPESIKIMSKREKEVYRRSELKKIKKKFNLHKEQYKQNETLLGPRYIDRAAERRITKGSDNPYEKDEIPTSLDTQLAEHNKGHQMLQKMGWSKGQGLGKAEKGITEPILPQGTGKGKLGLGFGNFHKQ